MPSTQRSSPIRVMGMGMSGRRLATSYHREVAVLHMHACAAAWARLGLGGATGQVGNCSLRMACPRLSKRVLRSANRLAAAGQGSLILSPMLAEDGDGGALA